MYDITLFNYVHLLMYHYNVLLIVSVITVDINHSILLNTVKECLTKYTMT